MQHTLYNDARDINSSTRLFQWIACQWDLLGVLTLIVSSAAYSVFAVAHLGY